jgi:drug/metabolite transporter superfamily protein YnfA
MAYQDSLRLSLRCGTWAALHSSIFGSPGVRLHARKLARSAIGKNGAAWLLVKVWLRTVQPASAHGRAIDINCTAISD